MQSVATCLRRLCCENCDMDATTYTLIVGLGRGNRLVFEGLDERQIEIIDHTLLQGRRRILVTHQGIGHVIHLGDAVVSWHADTTRGARQIAVST